jgi:hypothetical protein
LGIKRVSGIECIGYFESIGIIEFHRHLPLEYGYQSSIRHLAGIHRVSGISWVSIGYRREDNRVSSPLSSSSVIASAIFVPFFAPPTVYWVFAIIWHLILDVRYPSLSNRFGSGYRHQRYWLSESGIVGLSAFVASVLYIYFPLLTLVSFFPSHRFLVITLRYWVLVIGIGYLLVSRHFYLLLASLLSVLSLWSSISPVFCLLPSSSVGSFLLAPCLLFQPRATASSHWGIWSDIGSGLGYRLSGIIAVVLIGSVPSSSSSFLSSSLLRLFSLPCFCILLRSRSFAPPYHTFVPFPSLSSVASLRLSTLPLALPLRSLDCMVSIIGYRVSGIGYHGYWVYQVSGIKHQASGIGIRY